MTARQHNPVDGRNLPPERLQRHAAVHEAGHAVVGISRGLEIDRIEICPEGGWKQHPQLPGGSTVIAGTIFVAPDGDMNLLARARPEDMSVALLAGRSSEERLLGAHLEQCWAGDLIIIREGQRWTGAHDPGSEQLRAIQSKLSRLADEADEAVEIAVTDISAVAEELLSRRRLEGDDIARILKDHAR